MFRCQTSKYLFQLLPGLDIFVAMKTDTNTTDTLDYVEYVLPLLTSDDFTEKPAKQTNIVAQRPVLVYLTRVEPVFLRGISIFQSHVGITLISAGICAGYRRWHGRIILCTGKIYYELAKERTNRECRNVTLVRIEQLYPFPEQALLERLMAFPASTRVVWVQ